MSTQWFLKTDKEDLGPLSFEELTVLVQAGALTEEDFVRPESRTAWQPARSVSGLFASNAPTAAERAPRSAWSETVNSALASVDARRKGAQRHTKNVARRVGPSSFARAGASFGRGMTGVFSLFTDTSSSFVELVLSIGQAVWKSTITRVCAVILTLLAAGYVGYTAIPATWFLSTGEAYAAIEKIGRRNGEFPRGRASDGERESFVAESERQLARIVPLLEEQAGNDQVARELVYAARDCLPQMLSASPETDPLTPERRFRNHLARAKKIQSRLPPKRAQLDVVTIGILVVDVLVAGALIRLFVVR